MDGLNDIVWKVASFPHDLLKPFCWGRHTDTKVLGEAERLLTQYVVESFNTSTRKSEKCSLKKVIEGHHSMRKGLAQVWCLGDKLSSAIARLRYEYDYWHDVDGAEPFFVKVYGDVERWDARRVEDLKRQILLTLEEYVGRQEEGLAKVNELLSRFPSDSRFPFVSLKTHHWMTYVLHGKRCLHKLLANDQDVSKIALYMIRVSVAEPEFHRLRELRSFKRYLEEGYASLQSKLQGRGVIRIGDDLYLVTACDDEVEDVIGKVSESGHGFNVDVFKWMLKWTETAEGPLYVVEDEIRRPLAVGGCEELDLKPESYKPWAYLLEGRYRHLLWASIRPKGDMEEAAEEFLNWAEHELEKFRRKPCKHPIRQKVSLSPELLISIADGFNEFLSDCIYHFTRMQGSSKGYPIIRSFNRTMLVRSLADPSDAVDVYLKLAGLRRKLHISASIACVVCGPKYPFWRVLDLLGSLEDKGGGLAFELGEKMVQLDDRHAELLNRVRGYVRSERPLQIYRIARRACKDSKELLKLEIRAFAEQDKIDRGCAERLCWLIDEISRMHSNDEERREVTCRMFKILRMFARGGESHGGKG